MHYYYEFKYLLNTLDFFFFLLKTWCFVGQRFFVSLCFCFATLINHGVNSSVVEPHKSNQCNGAGFAAKKQRQTKYSFKNKSRSKNKGPKTWNSEAGVSTGQLRNSPQFPIPAKR